MINQRDSKDGLTPLMPAIMLSEHLESKKAILKILVESKNINLTIKTIKDDEDIITLA